MMEEHYKQAFIKVQRDRQKLIKQNKRLREAIIEAIADIEEIIPHEAKKTLREALKNIYELAEYDEYDNTLERIVSEIEKALEGER